jgi:hypothetical protein
MAIKGNAVPDAILFVRAEHFENVTMMLVQAQHDRQREHDLRVTMQNRVETAEAALKMACELLLFVQDNHGPIGPYASEAEESFSRHRWTDIDTFLHRYFAPPALKK